MNFVLKKRVNWIIAMAMLALPGTLMTSCSKETNPTEAVEPTSDKLVISVKGANIQQSDVPLKQGLPSKAKASTAAATHTVYEFADVDMAVSVGNNLPVKTINIATGGRRNGLAADVSTQAVEAIEAGVKYAVYIYEGSNFVSSALLEAGTAGTIEGLNPEGSYTWVALSYSDLEDAPAETPSGENVDLPQNKDVLYASGAINLAESNTIDITFDHVYSRVGIELNTIGVFGEITGTPAVSVSGLSLAAGSLNLLDGTLTASSETFEPTLTYADFVNVDEAYDDAMIAYVYTAPVAQQNFQLKIKDLIISHVDNLNATISRTFFATETPFNLSVTPEAGKSHHLLFNVVESPLTTYLGRKNFLGQMQNQVTVKWARSNLYYRGEGSNRNYAFYANNDQKRRADGYFAFEGLEPMSLGSSVEGGDPCTLVYPAGLWKTPTVTEVNSITTSSGVLGNVLGGILDAVASNPTQGTENNPLGMTYVEYDITAGGPASGENAFGDETSNSNNLRIFKNGQITNASVLTAIGDNGLLGLGLSDLSIDLVNVNILGTNISVLGDSYGSSGGLWTSSRLLSGPLLNLLGTSVGSQGYHVYQSAALIGGPFVKATTTAELLGNVDALGIDIANVSLKNVRCVRAN